MKQRPWPIIILSVFHLIAPFLSILINARLAKVSPAFYLNVLLTPEYHLTLLIFVLIPLLGGGLIYICRRWSYLSYLAVMTIPFVFIFKSYLQNETAFLTTALVLFYILNMLAVAYFLKPAIRRLYFDQRMRWWETKPRFKTDFKCQAEVNGQKHQVEIQNISEGGAFLVTSSDLKEGDQIQIFVNKQDQSLQLSGEIIYHRQNSPAGYGIKLSKESSKNGQFKKLLQTLQNDGALLESRLPGPEDTFINWLKTSVRKQT